VALLTYENGAWGSIVTTTASYPSLGSLIEMTGSNGTIVWKDGKINVYKLKNNPEPSLDEFKLDPNRPKNIIEDMVLAITKDTQPMVDEKEGRKSVAILNALYESSRTGKTIRVS